MLQRLLRRAPPRVRTVLLDYLAPAPGARPVLDHFGRRAQSGGAGADAGDQDLANPLHPWSGSTLPPLRVRAAGYGIIQNPLYNKGTAFSYPERDRLGLRGLLPPRRISMSLQMNQAMERLKALPSDIDRYEFMVELCDHNETLYHAMLVENIEYLAPIVYTPTVGLACQQFGYRFSRPRGMYISALDRGQMHACIGNWPHREVQVIVVTDGSRILGLGDLGAYGMGIPIGKLALYCAAGGIAPHRVLPVCLDVGTDNQTLLKDPYYIGLVQNRLRGDAYFELVDEFLDAVRRRFPNVFVQFEDFSSDVAMDILRYYRDELCPDNTREPVCVFNDDIQGTGAVVTAGLFSGLINRGESPENLKDQRIMIAGAGMYAWLRT
jgi:malate dehydrogenase (oxaloacetate-decarboxylating)(NADP+)